MSSSTNAASPRRRRILSVVAATVVALGPFVPALATADPGEPTLVLVHGAFADATSWDGVAAELRGRGYRVVVVDNPLRGPSNDAQALQGVLDTIDGPVVLVGHSYGGAVITNTHDPKVKANVYIAAFAPAQGEFVLGLLDPIRFPGSQLLPPALQVRVVDDATGVAGKNIDGYIAEPYFHGIFAQDVSDDTAANMYAHQHSAAMTANLEPSGAPSWAGTPNWYLISSDDRVIPATAQRFMAGRAAATTREISSSHASLVSQPVIVAETITEAANSVR
ncbi:alpha/beta fold hydrolase [Nocardia alba]|uniref:Pimeloyl-ACP methyl ester carboxylesterase n=1 Tax=Nocardia alba TaxID=225051 RepID=A0A4R1FS53_9NOCA|nr:alpha/beta hydrolase [Nocardia alba]TCJ96432.1 pimeloyl-ACP methyl ester carboxylesterase [Nocardia alba]